MYGNNYILLMKFHYFTNIFYKILITFLSYTIISEFVLIYFKAEVITLIA